MKTLFIRRDSATKRVIKNLSPYLFGMAAGVGLAYMFVSGIDRSNQIDLDREINLAKEVQKRNCTSKQNEKVIKDAGICTSKGLGDNHCWNLAIVRYCGK